MNKLQLQIVLYFVCATKNENDKITRILWHFYEAAESKEEEVEEELWTGTVQATVCGQKLVAFYANCAYLRSWSSRGAHASQVKPVN